jgi:hypothetical protein
VIRRILVILSLASVVGLMWTFLGHTSWAGSLDISTAGEQFTLIIEPIRLMAGALLVAVPSVLLIRAGWAWFDVWVLGNQPRARVRMEAPHSPSVAGSSAIAGQAVQRPSQPTSPGTPDRLGPHQTPAAVPTR